MQDKSYAIAIVLVLGICCLGMYVAVSGYLNSNPAVLIASPPPISQATQVVVNIPTDTPAPIRPLPTPPGAPTVPPVPSPLGAFQTITAAATISVPTQLAPTPRPAASATSASQLAAPACADFTFCPKPGSPDSGLSPGGIECPRNFIWGRVTDSVGKGIVNTRIRFQLLSTGESDSVLTKGPPDPQGIYNIPTGQPGGTWMIWIVDSGGNQASPKVTLTTQAYAGSGNCPTRVDFAQQR